MNIKLMPILTGAVVLAAAATPFVEKAVTATPMQPLLAQATKQERERRFSNLNLTQEQREQIKKIHEETRQKIEAVLTPQQRERYTAALQSRRSEMQNGNRGLNSSSRGQGRPQNVLATLNLSKDQRSQIREIMESSRSQMNTILTDSQREQLQQNRGSRVRNRAQ